ncbi:uncharacterized protein LOC143844925 isoform X2 [Paroedura picta]|uniref:uncharacterized protein LOC143844925 isoform X2 n=1 Tax=Paroedura picta TaxID=143630 RepID=UPI0040567462
MPLLNSKGPLHCRVLKTASGALQETREAMTKKHYPSADCQPTTAATSCHYEARRGIRYEEGGMHPHGSFLQQLYSTDLEGMKDNSNKKSNYVVCMCHVPTVTFPWTLQRTRLGIAAKCGLLIKQNRIHADSC